jgi:tRNA(Ile)-lysidine synthase
VAFFDRHALDFPLTLRNIRRGDRFQPLGLRGSQKLKKFFIDHKVDRLQRLRTPVLLSRGKVVWLVGFRIADSVKVTDNTVKVLRAELFLA